MTEHACVHKCNIVKHFPFAKIGVNLAFFFFFSFLSPCWRLKIKMSAEALATSTQPSFRQEEKEEREGKKSRFSS